MAIKTQYQKQSKRLVMSLLVLIFLGWVIIFAWVLSIWGLAGFDRATQFLYELSKQQTFAMHEFNDASIAERCKSWLLTLPTQTITNKLTKANHFIKNELNTIIPNDNSDLNNIETALATIVEQLWLLIRMTSHLMVIKLMILIASIPLFVLAITAGLVDGLNQRAIRTASLGRESSYVFHQLNRCFKRGLLLLLVLWLAIPVSITPAILFVPVSLLLSVMISMTASRFKKYM